MNYVTPQFALSAFLHTFGLWTVMTLWKISIIVGAGFNVSKVEDKSFYKLFDTAALMRWINLNNVISSIYLEICNVKLLFSSINGLENVSIASSLADPKTDCYILIGDQVCDSIKLWISN